MHHAYLYTPGDRPERVLTASSGSGPSTPDVVIIDLEDGVAMSAKAAARSALSEIMSAPATVSAGRPELHVRVNSGELTAMDVSAIAAALDGEPGALSAVVLAKATLSAVDDLARLLDDAGLGALAVTALIESARGVLDAPAIACHPRVTRLALGEADLCADLAMSPSVDGDELRSIRVGVVVASAAAGIEPPIGPVATDFKNLDALATSTAALRRLGFGARSAIHPAQVAVIREAFTPTGDEISSAKAVVAAFDAAVAEGRGAAVGPDGRMIDEAVVRSARRLLG